MSDIADIRRLSGLQQLHENLISQLDNFTRGYIAAMLGTTTDESDETGGDYLDSNYDVGDIHPDSLRGIAKDCQTFQKEGFRLLKAAYQRPGYHGGDGTGPESMAGHDFWLTRVGHGAGFWDRTPLEQGGLGDKLTELAKKFGHVDAYIGDDGMIHID